MLKQAALFREADLIAPPEADYGDVFRRLYYHLYSNSRASRAERIISDLSNLLLCKIASERNGGTEVIRRFLQGEGTANDLLLPLLAKHYPTLDTATDLFSLQDEALRHGLRELSQLSFTTAPAHALGDAFQALMGPRLRGDKGQFFTPKSLVRAMVAILAPTLTAKLVDPACGTGGFLAETHAFQMQRGDSRRSSKPGKLIGIDKDHDLCRLSGATLEVIAPHRSTVLNRNALDLAGLRGLPEDVSPIDADVILTNPPFGAKIKITEPEILSQFAFGHEWAGSDADWREQPLLDGQDPQILFLELCIELLRPGGRLGIVLPEGVFGNRGVEYVWDFVRSKGTIIALLDCPRTTFQPSTDTKTNVLFFEKAATAKPSKSIPQVWTAVALTCGHDRRGRNTKPNGEPYPDDYQTLGASYQDRAESTNPWQLVTITDPYYLVPRYYDAAPLRELEQEAARLGAELMSLGDMVKRGYVSIRKGHEPGAETYGTGDIPFVRTSDISNYEISIDPTRSVSEEVYERYNQNQKLKPGDLLMVCDGRYRIGRTAILHEYNYRCVVQSHVRIISVTSRSPITAVELLYLLNLPAVQHQIRNLVFIQSTLGALGKRLEEVCVPVPKRSPEWEASVSDFSSLIEQRAALLMRLREFEGPAYEL
jgi:type I restriction enzyme M protein